MSSVLRLFSRAVEQVAVTAEQQAGRGDGQSASWADRARRVGAAAAMSLAVAATVAPAHAQTVLQTPEQAKDEKARGKGSTWGGILGGIAGLVASKDQGGVAKVLSTALGAYAGSELGESLASRGSAGAAEGGSDPMEQIPTSLRDGRGQQVFVTRALAEDSAKRSASPVPTPAGSGMRALERDMHAGLYTLMVDMAAARIVAKTALEESDRRRLKAGIDGSQQPDADEAARISQAAFDNYNQTFRRVWSVMQLAEQGGYDVTPQRITLASIPADLRAQVPLKLETWPDVLPRAMAMAQAVDQPAGRVSVKDLQVQSAEAPRMVSYAAPRQR